MKTKENKLSIHVIVKSIVFVTLFWAITGLLFYGIYQFISMISMSGILDGVFGL